MIKHSKSHGDSKLKKLQRSHVDPKTQFVFIKLSLSQGGMSSGMDRQNLVIYIYIHVLC